MERNNNLQLKNRLQGEKEIAVVDLIVVRAACAILLESISPYKRVTILEKLLKEAREEAKKPQPVDARQMRFW